MVGMTGMTGHTGMTGCRLQLKPPGRRHTLPTCISQQQEQHQDVVRYVWSHCGGRQPNLCQVWVHHKPVCAMLMLVLVAAAAEYVCC
jgi:hypothetical protein